jgi:GTP-binding protein
MMYEFFKHHQIPCIIIATKADKIPKGKWQKHLKIVRETLDLDKNDQMVLFSSETGLGKDEAWSVLQSYM